MAGVRARDALVELDQKLSTTGVANDDLRYNLSWHDWMNLKNLILVSQAITASALTRENSRGAHFREDYPEAGSLEDSNYVCINWQSGEFAVTQRLVEFSMVRPGATILVEEEKRELSSVRPWS